MKCSMRWGIEERGHPVRGYHTCHLDPDHLPRRHECECGAESSWPPLPPGKLANVAELLESRGKKFYPRKKRR